MFERENGKWRRAGVVTEPLSRSTTLSSPKALFGNPSRAPSTMSISIPVTPLPLFNLAAPATYQGIEVNWILDPTAKPDFDGSSDVETIAKKLDANAPRDGPALPALPAPLDAATPFAEVAKILDALDDFLAYR